MRARLAIAASGLEIELREVVLRDKPSEMLKASPKGTVPVLVLSDSKVLEESLDVMDWALGRQDPQGWLDYPSEEIHAMRALISLFDGPFKSALDRYKYETRFDEVVAQDQRDLAVPFLTDLDERLAEQPFLFGQRFSLADAAILPFVRQYAHVDKAWFWAQEWANLIDWLDRFLLSERFEAIMEKYPKWESGDKGIGFGG